MKLMQQIRSPSRLQCAERHLTPLRSWWKAWYWGKWMGAREMQAVCVKAVTSSSVASPNFEGGRYFDLKQATVFCWEHCLSKHKMTRYVRKLWVHAPLGPSWLRLWLQEKNEKERTVLDVQFSTDKKLATTQDRQTLQNSGVSIGCYVWLLPTRNGLGKESLSRWPNLRGLTYTTRLCRA